MKAKLIGDKAATPCIHFFIMDGLGRVFTCQ